MAKAVKDMVTEKIEIVDQLDETSEKKGFRAWWLVPVAVVLVGAGAFFAVRRWFNRPEEA